MENEFGKMNGKDEMMKYLKRKIVSHRKNKDNKPFSEREIRLISKAFIAGFEHRYWKEKRRLEK